MPAPSSFNTPLMEVLVRRVEGHDCSKKNFIEINLHHQTTVEHKNMGVIRVGKVSGVIPTDESFAVHYPGYPSTISRAINTLGGVDGISKARSLQGNKLELYFRPEDPYSHPASGELHSCNNLLLKITKRKSNSSPIQTELRADIVSRIPEAYHFQGMVDYQHVVAVHAEAAHSKKRNWTEMEEPHFEKAGLMDLDQEDVMILPPPLFSPKDVPENVALRQPPASSTRKKLEDIPENSYEMNIEPALAIDFNVEEIPNRVNWKQYITQGSELWVWQEAVSELFDERPIWPKGSLTDRLLIRGLKFNHHALTRLLLTVAYYFSRGPFLKFWIRKGYDPRKDPDSRIYQRIDFRVPPLLRNRDAGAFTDMEHKWEKLCKFEVFPYKYQTSLQLYELDDDYIQQEIMKPVEQKTCTLDTGWFSPPLLESFRRRVMVKFLEVYLRTGAEKLHAKKLLRNASEEFEKFKRACIYRDASKPSQVEDLQINRGENPTQNQKNVDGEMDEVESDDHEEELDDALDLAGQDDEVSLQSDSYTGSNSRSYLQELFDSFPYMDASVDMLQDGDSSGGEEYQIYEQENDESYSDEDDE